MTSQFNFDLFFALVTAAVILFLGILAYLHDRRNVTNKIFFLHTLVIAGWTLVNYISLHSLPEKTLLWIRGVMLLVVPHVFLFFLFVANFPHATFFVRRRYLWLLLFLMAGMMFLTLTPLIFESIIVNNDHILPIPIPGKLMPIFSAVLVLVSMITVMMIIRKYLHSDIMVKKKWLSIGAGLIIAYLLLIFFVFLRVVLFADPSFVPYSPLFVLPIFIGAAYAILRHNLLNIRVIAAELFTFVILIASFTQILLAETRIVFYLSAGTTIILFAFGILLIRSVLKEVWQREEMEILSRELASANEELKKLDQAKSEFISIASHQLRTPLTVIKGYISLILEGSMGKIAKSATDALQKTAISTEQLVKLVADLLNLSRIESGKIRYEFTLVDFPELIKNVMDEFKHLAEKKGVMVHFNNNVSELPLLSLDSDKIHEAIFNLIDNAVKYTKEKSRIDVTISKPFEGWVRVTVRDQGIGIRSADIKKLFIKFNRTDEARIVDQNGMGIGLYFVKRIVEDHGGKVHGESEGLNKGSTFYIELPIK